MLKNKFEKIFLSLCLLTALAVYADGNIVNPDLTNWEDLYEQQEVADFEYMFGIDPYQNDEYKNYMYSPYPLFRLGVPLIFKTITITPGY